MKYIINIGALGLAVLTVGPLAWYTLLLVVKAIPVAGFVGTVVFAAAALDAARSKN